MKISYRWLREYVDTDLPPAQLADRLTNAGVPVEGLAPVVEGLSGVVVGEIEAIEREVEGPRPRHANRLCRVALPDRKLSILCGAPNAAPGLRTAVAPPGASLPGGRAITAATIRGTLSEGMLCSEKELGIGEDAAGILALPADAPLGADLATYLGLDDTIFEIEITPNRPDVLAIVGVAREVAALTGAPFRYPQVTVKEGESPAAALAAVEIADPDLCPRYAARVITGLTVKPSPPWLAQRLRTVGLRPINNVVDVTNYVLWELGQPLHAFDRDRLEGGRIVVRRARPGERLTTLDGRERALAPDMLMICDAARPVAVGGVMGGADSEVRAGTTTVLLESACFNPGSIRRTSRALSLSSDASYRFERGADIEGVIPALDRAAYLMADLGGGTVAHGVLDVYPAPRPHSRIALRLERVERVIGAAPPRAEAVRILQALGFAVDDTGPTLQVVVPSFRRDIVQEDDLVEEIVRIWGYDQIPLILAGGGELSPVTRPAGLRVTRAASRALVDAGLAECITYAFVDPARLKLLGWDDPARLVALQNPLSAERSVMRPSLLPGLLEVLATNVHRQNPDVRAFEVGTIFSPHRESDGDRPAHEELWLGLALTGLRAPRAWHSGRERVDVYDAKGMAELVLAAAGAPRAETTPWGPGQEPAYLEPGRSARLVREGEELGWFGEVSAQVREAFDLDAPVFAAGVALGALAARPTPVARYAPLPRFPAVQRDLALVVADDVTVAQVEAAIRGMDAAWLTRVQVFDVYSGSQVGAGRRSLAFGLTFQAPDRTLTDAEVNEQHARVVRELGRRFGAEVRGA
jgi:phenylalanyl-tRNA synthetase beta chain